MTATRFAAIVMVVVSTACAGGGDEPPEIESPESDAPVSIQVEATEYAYEMPDEIPAGFVTLDFVNVGDQPHEFGFVRLTQGRTVGDLRRLFTKSAGGNPLWPEEVGGLSALSPGQSASMTKDLEEGSYAFFCLLPTPKGEQHVDEGMIAGFRVGPLAVESKAPDPEVVIVGDETGYDVPQITPGRRLVEFRNATSDREILFHLSSLNPGRTPADVTAWYESGYRRPAPVVFPGSAREVAPSESSFIEIDFESGRTYTMIDPINDFETDIVVP